MKKKYSNGVEFSGGNCYKTPEMKVVQLQLEQNILGGSTDRGFETPGWGKEDGIWG